MMRAIVLVLPCVLGAVLVAQPPAFEVVSIKPTPPGTQGGGLQLSPGGRVTWTNATLKGLVAAAYQRFTWDSREIIGGPGWFNDVRFDVIALATGGYALMQGLVSLHPSLRASRL